MIKPEWLKMLESGNASQRRQAIMALGKSQDADALPHLMRVYRGDPDPELRELARKAGAYIRKQTGGAVDPTPARTTPPARRDEYDDEYGAGYDDGSAYRVGYYDDDRESDYAATPLYDAPEDEKPQNPRVEVSQRDEQKAMRLVQQAENVYDRGKTQQAIKYLRQAFQVNPNLAYDRYSVGVAGIVTGLPSERAVQALIAGASVGAGAVHYKGKRVQDAIDEDDPGWRSVWVDLAIYWLVNIGFSLAALVLVGVFLVWVIGQVSAAEAAVIRAQNAELLEATAVFLIRESLVNGTGSLIGLLIQYALLHFTAIFIMGGEGTFTRLIRQATLFYAFAYPAFAVVMVLVFFWEGLVLGRFVMLPLVSIAGSVFILFYTSFLIGRTYRFGTARGCATMIVSYVLTVCVLFMLIYTLVWLAVGALSFP